MLLPGCHGTTQLFDISIPPKSKGSLILYSKHVGMPTPPYSLPHIKSTSDIFLFSYKCIVFYGTPMTPYSTPLLGVSGYRESMNIFIFDKKNVVDLPIILAQIL